MAPPGDNREVVVDIGGRQAVIEINMPVARIVDVGIVRDGADRLNRHGDVQAGAYRLRIPFNITGGTVMSGSINPWPVVKTGSSEHPIKTLQYLLRARGHSVVVDGVFGPKTDAAVRAFQSGHGLTVDGIVGPMTWAALVVQVKKGSQGDAVKGVQEEFQFRNLSGDPSKGPQVDGVFGPTTDAEVRGFQHALSLDIPTVKVDGIVGPVTWQALASGMLSF